MQLKKPQAGQVRKRLSGISAGLLAATIGGHAARAQGYYDYEDPLGTQNNNFGPGFAYSQFDAALLVYQEGAGRVSAIEPTATLAVHAPDGRQLTLGLVADAVSGATPNGAVPSSQPQDFVTPIKAEGSTASVTSASGGSTIIHLPPSPGQLAAAALGRQYTVPANTLPMDRGFRDHRGAATIGWSQPLGSISDAGFGMGYSREQDYQAVTLNSHVAQNFNANNTTVSLTLNGEFDSSFPFGGTPTPLTVMSAQWKTPKQRGKTQLGFVLGLTQVMTRRWLMELNYSFDRQNGYQNDPYRIISLVDPSSGDPTTSYYESRPGKRQSQSIFWDNRLDLGGAITDLGLRYYTDSWGIKSQTAELSERIGLGGSFYIEPNVRWYHQTAADFFHYYLVAGQAMPAFASSDIRLGNFSALTVGAQFGFKLDGRSEIYIKGGYYSQTGNGHPSGAIGQLAQQNLFSGVKSTILFMGYKWDFH